MKVYELRNDFMDVEIDADELPVGLGLPDLKEDNRRKVQRFWDHVIAAAQNHAKQEFRSDYYNLSVVEEKPWSMRFTLTFPPLTAEDLEEENLFQMVTPEEAECIMAAAAEMEAAQAKGKHWEPITKDTAMTFRVFALSDKEEKEKAERRRIREEKRRQHEEEYKARAEKRRQREEARLQREAEEADRFLDSIFKKERKMKEERDAQPTDDPLAGLDGEHVLYDTYLFRSVDDLFTAASIVNPAGCKRAKVYKADTPGYVYRAVFPPEDGRRKKEKYGRWILAEFSVREEVPDIRVGLWDEHELVISPWEEIAKIARIQ